MPPHDPYTLASTVRYSGPMFTRFLEGFDDDIRTAQAPGLPNHCAWTIGHLTLVMGTLAERSGAGKLPEDAFARGGSKDSALGNQLRYDAEGVAIGSIPIDDPHRYPTLDRACELFDISLESLASAVANLTREQIDEPISWGGKMIPRGDLILRVSLHNATHAGQIADLRRALGMPRIIG